MSTSNLDTQSLTLRKLGGGAGGEKKILAVPIWDTEGALSLRYRVLSRKRAALQEISGVAMGEDFGSERSISGNRTQTRVPSCSVLVA